jgi:hypothetical protein
MPRYLAQFNERIEIEIPNDRELLFVNVGEPNNEYRRLHNNGINFHNHRMWEDSLTFGFTSGGQIDPTYQIGHRLRNRWITQMHRVNSGDIICVYVTGLGFVGVGVCTSAAAPIMERQLADGSYLRGHRNELANPLLFRTQAEVNQMGFQNHIPNTYGCEKEYAILVTWIRTYKRNEIADTLQNGRGNLGITEHVVSSMMTPARQRMVQFVQELFNVEFIPVIY